MDIEHSTSSSHKKLRNGKGPNTDRFLGFTKEAQGITFVCLTGHSCSGKTTVAQMLEELGCPIFRNTPLIIQHMSQHRLPMKELLMKWGRGRSLFYFFEPVLREATRDTHLIVVDSFKTAHDPLVIHQLFENSRVKIVHVHADFDIRLGRLAHRHNQVKMNPSVLRSRDDEELEVGMPQLFQDAVFRLNTNVPLNTLYTQVEALFEKHILLS